jgi:hypothetical protein
MDNTVKLALDGSLKLVFGKILNRFSIPQMVQISWTQQCSSEPPAAVPYNILVPDRIFNTCGAENKRVELAKHAV